MVEDVQMESMQMQDVQSSATDMEVLPVGTSDLWLRLQ